MKRGVCHKTCLCISQSYFVQHIFIFDCSSINMNQPKQISKNIKKSLQQNTPMVFESYQHHLELLEDIEVN